MGRWVKMTPWERFPAGDAPFEGDPMTATGPPTSAGELSREELQRYSRHLIMPEVGLDGQKKLKAARVLCVGAGGLGSPPPPLLPAGGGGPVGPRGVRARGLLDPHPHNSFGP